jgi:hypothetical protein
MGPGKGEEAKVKLSNVNVLRSLAKTTLVISKLERLRKIFGGRPVPAPTSLGASCRHGPQQCRPSKNRFRCRGVPRDEAADRSDSPTGEGCSDGTIQKIENNIGIEQVEMPD